MKTKKQLRILILLFLAKFSVYSQVMGTYSVGLKNDFINVHNLRAASGTSYNTAIGTYVMSNGDNNTPNGTFSGNHNTAIGGRALLNSNISNANCVFGYQAMMNSTDAGLYNIAIGFGAMQNANQTQNNIAIGGSSLASIGSTSMDNVAIGHATLSDATNGALGNVVIGSKSMQNSVNSEYNTILGFSAYQIATGARNSSLGSNAGSAITTGSENVTLGFQAGVNIGSGSFNVAVGSKAQKNNSNGNSNIMIGYNVQTIPSLNNNFLNIGNVIYGNNMYGVSSADGTTTARARVGILSNQPGNTLEVNAESSNQSGLRFSKLKSTFNPTSSVSKFLTVDANGDVVLRNIPASTGSTITNVLSSSGNIMSSFVNSVQADAPIINSVLNTINNGELVTTVNGVASSPVTIAGTSCNLYTCDGTINTTSGPNQGVRTVTMGNNNLVFQTNPAFDGNGRVYIGASSNNFTPITATSRYRLFVEGGILTERVKVATNGTVNWADYVFADDYKLMPLNEVETFIAKNNHLPGIESAETLSKEGLDLGAMQAKQMAKIEELTLYVIQQNKEIEELKAQVKVLLEKNK